MMMRTAQRYPMLAMLSLACAASGGRKPADSADSAVETDDSGPARAIVEPDRVVLREGDSGLLVEIWEGWPSSWGFGVADFPDNTVESCLEGAVCHTLQPDGGLFRWGDTAADGTTANGQFYGTDHFRRQCRRKQSAPFFWGEDRFFPPYPRRTPPLPPIFAA